MWNQLRRYKPGFSNRLLAASLTTTNDLAWRTESDRKNNSADISRGVCRCPQGARSCPGLSLLTKHPIPSITSSRFCMARTAVSLAPANHSSSAVVNRSAVRAQSSSTTFAMFRTPRISTLGLGIWIGVAVCDVFKVKLLCLVKCPYANREADCVGWRNGTKEPPPLTRGLHSPP